MKIAVIKTGGKQYKVKKGSKVKIEKISGKAGQAVKFNALLLADENGKSVEIGKPLTKTKVEGKILKQGRAKKVAVIKYKRKTRYRRNLGHRQPYTEVEIVKI